MHLFIRHVTASRFDAPMRGVIQSQRLVPQDGPAQRVLDWNVSVSPEAVFGPLVTDGLGDAIRTVTVSGPLDALEVVAEGTVETEDRAGILGVVREAVPPGAWLSPTALTRADSALREMGEGAGASLESAHRLMGTVAEAVVFEADVTDPATTASEALAAGRGVCQDLTHVMIAAARAGGAPARYVVGYLEAGTGTGVSHAWTELWIDGLGWVGFDPTNGVSPDERYVRLCCGRDALGAAPIRGAVRGLGTETQDAHVQISQVQQQ